MRPRTEVGAIPRLFPRPRRTARAARAGLCSILLLFAVWVSRASETPSASSSAGSYAAINGVRMYYLDQGKGPALFLLHGGGGDGSQFSKQIPFFVRRFRVVVPDACAQGRTSDRDGPLTYHAMAEDLVALMDHLHIRKADLMGWSDGGITGIDLALHHPERVNHLVAFGANFRPDGLIEREVAWDDTATVAAFGEEGRRAYEALAPDPSHYAQAMQRILTLWRTQPEFSPEDLHRIRARVLIAAGERDVVRREHTEQLAAAIPGARLWIVPGATHRAIFEQPDLVERVVLDFLEQ